MKRKIESMEYAVIFIADSKYGKIMCHNIKASSPMQAFWKVAKSLDYEADFVYALPWSMYTVMQAMGESDFPGESLVSSTTVLSQSEVFNPKKRHK